MSHHRYSLHQSGSQPAKPVEPPTSWCYARFFPAMLSQRIAIRLLRASQKEIAPSAQVHRVSSNISSLGFTLVELLVVIVVLGVLSTASVTFFSTAFVQYLSLQEDANSIGDLAVQSQRIASVVRGSTDIISAANNDLSVYAYFYPNDTYESQVRYYKSADGKKLFAEVTPMTANHPIGAPIIANKQTFTIIGNFYTLPGVNLFNYLNSASATIATPITDLRTIKGIRINLAEPFTNSIAVGENPMSLVVSLRNRKTNL